MLATLGYWPRRLGAALLGIGALIVFPTASRAAGWATEFAPYGLDDQVQDIVVHDGVLYIGGQFDEIACQAVESLARWDGEDWRAVIPGDPTRSSIYSFQVLGTDLYFIEARFVNHSMQTRACRLDGSGFVVLDPDSDLNPSSLTVRDGQLYAAGRFRDAADPWERFVARWTGTAWETVTSGVPWNVSDLAVYQGDFVIGGDNGNTFQPELARWDGATWQPIGGGVGGGGHVEVLTVIGSDLYVLGTFDTVDGINSEQIGRWDGVQWHQLPGRDGFLTLAAVEFGGALYAAGNVMERWTGSAWENVDTGIGPNSNALGIFDGTLITGGSFNRRIGASANRIASWNGASWDTMEGTISKGVEGTLLALTPFGGSLAAGGFATRFGEVVTFHLALWDGASWSAFPETPPWGVRHLLARTDGLYAAEHTDPTPELAHWDGVAWQMLAGGLSGPSTYFDDPTVADLLDHSSGLLAVGDMNAAGATPLFGTALWNGTSWQPFAGSPGGTILCGTMFGGNPVVGGRGFATAMGTRQVLEWNGVEWLPLGGAFNGTVSDLTVCEGKLIAAGSFTTVDGQFAFHVAGWDGTAWAAMGGGVPGEGWRLGSYGGEPILVDRLGPTPYVYEAYRWNGSAWESFGELDDAPHAVLAFDERLYFAGYFESAGGIPAFHFTYFADGTVAVGDDTGGRPLLGRNHPNPFRAATTISFVLEKAGPVSLTIFDVAGHQIARPFDSWASEGWNAVTWNGRSASGADASAGVYFYRIEGAGEVVEGRMLKVR